MRPVTIVTLSRYMDFFNGYASMLSVYAPNVPKILVRDGDEIPLSMLGPDWTVLQGPPVFDITKNINMGWKAAPTDSDVFFVSDDIRFTQQGTVEKMQALMSKHTCVGILSPRLVGRGSSSLQNPSSEICETTPDGLWYPCPFIRREVFNEVGYMDEGFPFGKDDVDLNIRTINAGFRLAVTNAVSVIHLETPDGASSSARKTYTAEERAERMAVGVERLREKYGDDYDRIMHSSWSERR